METNENAQKALAYFKSKILPNFDFEDKRTRILKRNPIEVLTIFGSNITAKYDHRMGAWYQLESRNEQTFGFYLKDEKLKSLIDKKISDATTCKKCGLKGFTRSDGYPSNSECPYKFPENLECETIENNEFSFLVPNWTR